VALEPGVFAWAVRPLCAAAAGARGAAHSVNGASGPPAMATTIAPRQMVSPAADTAPIRRMVRRRRPDGSANTGLECTSRSVATPDLGQPWIPGPTGQALPQHVTCARVAPPLRPQASRAPHVSQPRPGPAPALTGAM